MGLLEPHFEILPPAQRRLWPELKEIPRHFVLYGGTALALHLGHRSSVDFDFFSSRRFEAQELLQSLSLLHGARVLQNVTQTLTVAVGWPEEVKISFFGGLPLGRVGEPQSTFDHVVNVASLLDLAGTKVAVITQRAEHKDFIDLLALVDSGVTVPNAMAAGSAIYGRQYNPAMTLKSLTYFGDGDLYKLTPPQKRRLEEIAASAELILPPLPRIADTVN